MYDIELMARNIGRNGQVSADRVTKVFIFDLCSRLELLINLVTSNNPDHCTWFLSICAWLETVDEFQRKE